MNNMEDIDGLKKSFKNVLNKNEANKNEANKNEANKIEQIKNQANKNEANKNLNKNNEKINEEEIKNQANKNEANRNLNKNNEKINEEEIKNKVNHKIKCNFCFIGSILILFLAIFIFYLQCKHQKLLITIYKYVSDYFSKDKEIYEIYALQTIIGIDFGSTYSGYSIINEGEKLDNINFDEKEIKLISSELITDGNEPYYPLRIGEVQAHKYNKKNLVEEKKLYFSKFKINLDPNINNNNIISADIPKNKTINLDKVIEGYLTLLRKEVFNDNPKLKNNNNIKWVLTVPPLWDDKAKSFMKEVSFQAGMINSDIALEPEAASLSIFYDNNINREKYNLTKGNSFILVDAGGYTVDISANKILDDNDNLEQIILPKSFVLGSYLINKHIIEIIEYVYGKDLIEKIIKNDYDKWEKLLDSIEEQKIGLGELEDIKFGNFKFPIVFIEGKCNGNWIKDECEVTYNNTIIKYSSKYIFIPKELIINLINRIAESIVDKIGHSFSQTNEIIKTIILTGGFSNCQILKQKIEEKFEGPKNLVFLKDPQKTVAKGSSIFGLKPNQILKRKCPITIGVESYEYINEEEKEKECNDVSKDEDGLLICKKNITFAEIEESIVTNSIIENKIKPLNEEIKIYYRKNKELSNKGKILKIMQLSPSDLPLKNRTIIVSMKFSNYINITVIDKELNDVKSEVIFYP